MLFHLIHDMSGSRRKFLLAVRLCIILSVLLTGLLFSAGAESAVPEMQLHQVNVGCANCHLLIAGDTVILVDGGSNWYKGTGNSPDKMMEYIAETGIDHIDVHFVTHYHNDHALHIPYFSEVYGREDTVLYGTSAELPEKFRPLPNGSYRHLKKGDELDIGPFHALCVGPSVVRFEGEINEDSLNILVTYGEFRMLFTGDYLSDDVWRDYGDEVRNVDVLVFPHHGLEPFMATSGALQEINPKVILIPGDPEGMQKVRCRRLHLNPEIYGNHHGNIVILSDGNHYTVHEHAEPGEFREQNKTAPEQDPGCRTTVDSDQIIL